MTLIKSMDYVACVSEFNTQSSVVASPHFSALSVIFTQHTLDSEPPARAEMVSVARHQAQVQSNSDLFVVQTEAAENIIWRGQSTPSLDELL